MNTLKQAKHAAQIAHALAVTRRLQSPDDQTAQDAERAAIKAVSATLRAIDRAKRTKQRQRGIAAEIEAITPGQYL